MRIVEIIENSFEDIFKAKGGPGNSEKADFFGRLNAEAIKGFFEGDKGAQALKALGRTFLNYPYPKYTAAIGGLGGAAAGGLGGAALGLGVGTIDAILSDGSILGDMGSGLETGAILGGGLGAVAGAGFGALTSPKTTKELTKAGAKIAFDEFKNKMFK